MRTSLLTRATLTSALGVVAARSDSRASRPSRSRVRSSSPTIRSRASPTPRTRPKVQEWDIGLIADLTLNVFCKPGDPTPNVRAQNVNTIDEVPDSSWFTNRVYAKPLSVDDLTRGANTIDGPAAGKWTIIRAKTAGTAPGFTVRDEAGNIWFLSMDAHGYPVAATAAIAVATRLFWGLGYYVPESYLTTLRPENIVIGDKVTIPSHGRRRRFTHADLRDVFARANKSADGTYRVMAQRGLPGRVIGGFKILRDASRRSQRHRAARAPARAARAPGLRRVDQPRRHEGRQYARHRHHRERPLVRAPLPAGRRIDVRHRLARPARPRRGPRARLPGRTDGQASRHGRVSTFSRGRPSTTRGTTRSASSPPTRSSRKNGPRACRPARSCGSAPTTRSGRRCA